MVMHKGNRKINLSYRSMCKMTVRHIEKGICDIFIDAMKRNDADKIIEIAQAVWFFKDKRYPMFKPIDRERGLLLFAKARLDFHEQQWTIREVSEYLSGGKKVETPADGFSALRRKCRELNFPLAESRKRKIK